MDGEAFLTLAERHRSQKRHRTIACFFNVQVMHTSKTKHASRSSLVLWALKVWVGKEMVLKRELSATEWLRSKANSIEGGTSEVQLNIVT